MIEERTEYVTGTAVVPVQADVPMSIEAARDRHNLVVQFVKTILHEGIDYGKVPGIARPFLLKPGAEKLAKFFGLRSEMEEKSCLEDWDKPLFSYSYMATLRYLGEIVAQCEGACNSMESKYRWRKVWDWDATDETKRDAHHTKRMKDRKGKWHDVYYLPNEDIFSQVNTLRKMAQKRALVGAVLIACNASEFFSHRFEEIANGEYEEVPEAEPEPLSDARAIKNRLHQKAATFKKDGEVTDGQRGLMVGKIAEVLQDKDDKPRHLILGWLWGKESSKEMSYGEVGAMLDWLILNKDEDTGEYVLDPLSAQNLQVVFKEAQIDAGQEIMELYGPEDIGAES